jgi:hypothetical protein
MMEEHMRTVITGAAATIAAFASQAGVGQALPDNTLPACVILVHAVAEDPDGNEVDEQKGWFDKVTAATTWATGSETATANVKRGPEVSASASATGFGTPFVPMDEADASITYAFELFGPDGPVGVDYTASGSVKTKVANLDGDGIAMMGIIGPGIDLQVCGGGQDSCGDAWSGSDSYSAIGTLTLQANTVYYARVAATVNDQDGPLANGTISADSRILVGVNPDFAAQYKIKFSKGVLPRR